MAKSSESRELSFPLLCESCGRVQVLAEGNDVIIIVTPEAIVFAYFDCPKCKQRRVWEVQQQLILLSELGDMPKHFPARFVQLPPRELSRGTMSIDDVIDMGLVPDDELFGRITNSESAE